MPQTAILFLVAAVAICGLPPLNGFISEFLIFGGLYNWLYSANLISLITIVFSLMGLVLIQDVWLFYALQKPSVSYFLEINVLIAKRN